MRGMVSGFGTRGLTVLARQRDVGESLYGGSMSIV